MIGFLINVQVQGQDPHQWAPFQIAGLLHTWQISHQISRYVYHRSCSLTLQICLIIALSFRCRRWRFGFVNGQVWLAWSIALFPCVGLFHVFIPPPGFTMPTVWPSCATYLLSCLEQSSLDVVPDILSGPISYTCRCAHMQVDKEFIVPDTSLPINQVTQEMPLFSNRMSNQSHFAMIIQSVTFTCIL